MCQIVVIGGGDRSARSPGLGVTGCTREDVEMIDSRGKCDAILSDAGLRLRPELHGGNLIRIRINIVPHRVGKWLPVGISVGVRLGTKYVIRACACIFLQ